MLRRYELVVRVLVVALIGSALATLGGVNAVVAQDVRLAQDARAIAQTGNGVLKGKVVDSETAEGLIGATVRVLGTRYGANTNLDGDFQIDALPVGKYKLSVNYVGYQADSFNIEIKANVGTIIEIKLLPQGMSVATVQIVADRSTISSTDVSVLNEIRSARVSASGVSTIQISRSLDRDAADVVKRVPGVTIQGDRFVVIRGLSERYNSVTLNDVPAPSADADKRSFSFDLIPSNLIDRLIIFKAPAAELAGDFAGGAVKIYTKNSSDAFQIALSLGTSYRSGSSFQDGFNGTQGSSTDWLGYDNGGRLYPTIPRNLATASLTDNITSARAFRNEWVPTSETSPLDYKVGLNYYDSYTIFGKKLRNLTSINYSRSYEHYRITRRDLAADASTSYQYNDLQSSDAVRIGLLQNFSLSLNEKNRIEWKTFFNQIGTDQATSRYGFELQQARYAYALYYKSRSLVSSQLSGVHQITDQLQFDWFGGFNYTDRQEPDFRRVLLQGGPANSSDPAQYPEVSVQPGGAANPKISSRFFSSLYERSYTGGFNLEQKWEGGWVLKVGGLFKEEDRNFATHIYNFVRGPLTQSGLQFGSPNAVFGPANLRFDGTGYQINEFVGLNDYDASNRLLAGYVAGNIPLFAERLNVYMGARFEQNTQTLNYLATAQLRAQQVNIFPTILPSANVTFKLNATNQIRASYGRTVNRPELREIAPFTFYDFDLQSLTVGNRFLRQATIDNIDLKYEWYPSLNEVLSIGGFYKSFLDPIEQNSSPATPDRAYKPQNAKDAYTAGIEIEVRKNFAFISEGYFFKNLSATLNASYIFSKVNQIDSVGSAQIQNRPLQGQSPYIFNAGLFWQDEEKGWQVNVLYNVFGNRIFAVGDQSGAGVAGNPTIFERPRNVIDLSITKKLGKSIEIKLGISDLLNQPVRFFQDFNNNKTFETAADNAYFSYRPGQVYSFTVTYKIF